MCIRDSIITNLGKKNKVDPLTGLFNKFEFENRIQQLTESETPRSIAVLLLDLDDYQRVNTLYDLSLIHILYRGSRASALPVHRH